MMFIILDVMQVTFVTEPIVDLPTASLNSQGMGPLQKWAMLRSTCLLSSSWQTQRDLCAIPHEIHCAAPVV